MVTDRESKFTIREPRAMAVGVPFKIMSNGTSGTVGKVWLQIVKVKFTIREPRVMAVAVPFKIMSNGTSGTVGKIWLRFVKESLPSVNQLRAMEFGVLFKILSNGTTGTVGKIWLRIVKLRLPSLNYVQIVAKIDILMRIKGYIIYLYSLKRLANNIKIYIIYIMR
jgi:hypothetical protein